MKRLTVKEASDSLTSEIMNDLGPKLSKLYAVELDLQRLKTTTAKMEQLLRSAMSRCLGEKDGSCWGCKRDKVLEEYEKLTTS